MDEFLKVILNIRSLRAALRELSVDQIDDALHKLTQIYDERKDEDDRQKKLATERAEKLKEFSELLVDNGIKPEELVEFLGGGGIASHSPAKSKRPPRPAKYRYTDGLETKEWTGQGRMPKVIAEAISKGSKLEDFLI